MATELSNYDNDYRVRYRITATTDLGTPAVRLVLKQHLTDNNVRPLPDEAEYSMYNDGDGSADDPFERKTPTDQGDS